MPLHIARQKEGVVWHGSFFATHSLALVNRELTLALLDNSAFCERFELGLDHLGPAAFAPAEADARFAELDRRVNAPLGDVRLTVRHRWPPLFERPANGRLVMVQPWEFGSLPAEWVRAADSVDEFWAYTEHVRQTYINSGVPGEKVFVVPAGVNTARFHPNAEPFDLSRLHGAENLTPDTFKFLFVGGTISRKGIDVLLDAYDRAFSAGDDVVLIVKDFGGESFYANQGAGALIRALQAKPNGAKIVYLTEDVSEAEIAGLYAACDCLVHPYRGEGYGLPIAEAMACGKPTILTNYGAALDFANSDVAYLVNATVQRFPEKRIGDTPTVDFPSWAEPNRDALRASLLHVVNNRDEARAKGELAAAHIVAHHTWAHAAEKAAARLIALADQPVTASAELSLPLNLGGLRLGGSLSIDTGSAPTETPLITIGPDTGVETRKQAALATIRTGDWKGAHDLLDSCLAEAPDDWDIVNALAVAAFRIGQTDRAIQLLSNGLNAAPNKRDFHHNLAYILIESGNALEALKQALLAYQFTPDSPEIHRTIERARDGVLHQARKILRRYPDKDRARAKKDAEYVALMEIYRDAGTVLGVASSGLSQEASTQTPNPKQQRPLLSLVMIVKNEERFLRGCLESVRGVADEIVIVDTGSTDGTISIAREFGAKIVEHAWNEDFSEARNVALAHATGRWALWLDADEEIAPESREALRQVVRNSPAEVGGFMIKFRNWLTEPKRGVGEMAVHHACRLFRLQPGVRFEGRIHEQNLRSIQELGYIYARAEGVIIDHFGYAGEIMALRNKHERFIRMLHREVEEEALPQFRIFHLFNLGNAYFTFGDMENAARYLMRAAEEPDATEEYTLTLFMEIATALHRLGRSAEGLRYCEQADALGLIHAGIEFARGFCLLHLSRYPEAERAFREALRLGREDGGTYAESGDRGVVGFKAQYGLGLALVGQERQAEAVEYCRAAVSAAPGFSDARYLLGVALRDTGSTEEAAEALEEVLRHEPTHREALSEVGVLLYRAARYERALPHLRRAVGNNGFDGEALARLASCCEALGLMHEARENYERLRALAPGSAEVCVNLGRTLAAVGAEAEAIDAFADAIHINPQYGNAYFNAGDLLYGMGYYAKAAETYQAGLGVEPARASGFFVLGNCYVQTHDYEAAALCFEHALKLEPSLNDARSNLELARELAEQAA